MKRFFKNKKESRTGGKKKYLLVLAAAASVIAGAALSVFGAATAEDVLATHTVETVSPSTITIDLFDYSTANAAETLPDLSYMTSQTAATDATVANSGINSGHVLKFTTGKYYRTAYNFSINGSLQDMVTSTLVDGYP